MMNLSNVPVPDRKTGQLNVNTIARSLIVYTIRITSNEKWFPQDQKAFTENLRDCAIKIGSVCWEANEIKVAGSESKFRRRKELQEEAISLCNRMCFLIEIAQPLFHLKSKRTRYWKNQVIHLRTIIGNWRLENTKRLDPKNSGTENEPGPETPAEVQEEIADRKALEHS